MVPLMWVGMNLHASYHKIGLKKKKTEAQPQQEENFFPNWSRPLINNSPRTIPRIVLTLITTELKRSATGIWNAVEEFNSLIDSIQ